MTDKTLAEHAEHHAGKDVQLEQHDDDTTADEACGATAHLNGKVRTCSKPADHDGKHKRGNITWRPRSGDHR